MLSPEEIAAWSLDEVREAVIEALPSGWSLSEKRESEGFHTVTLWSPGTPDPSPELIREGVDIRLLLLDSFGHLWLRGLPRLSHDSPWSRRARSDTPRYDHARVGGPSVQDPVDLDPSEIKKLLK